jgi:subtilase family serine protease
VAGLVALVAVAVAVAVAIVGFVLPMGRKSDNANANQVHRTMSFTPRELRVGYAVQPLLDRGIDGHGQTVMMVEAAASTANSPSSAGPFTDIRRDLAAFDRRYRMPASNLTVSVPRGLPSTLRWQATDEEVLDAEMVHAIAPAAAIRVLLYHDQPTWGAYLIDWLTRALADPDRPHVITVTYMIPEACVSASQLGTIHGLLKRAAARNITVLALSGDYGAAIPACFVSPIDGDRPPSVGVMYPASDPLVTAVGGTRLALAPATGEFRDEVAWKQPSSDVATVVSQGWSGSFASGGGISDVYRRPAYQTPPVLHATGFRAIPDVAADADGDANLGVVTVLPDGRLEGTIAFGTSASTPLWAGIVALADQYAGRPLGFINAGLYRIADSSAYHEAFHDTTSGNDDLRFSIDAAKVPDWHAGPGWDFLTGLGSPDAAKLVPLLATAVHPTDADGL